MLEKYTIARELLTKPLAAAGMLGVALVVAVAGPTHASSLTNPQFSTIDKLNPNGSIQWRAQPVNLYDRQLMYLYPGESTEIWLNFFCPKGGGYGLQEGSYRSSSAWCAGSMTSTIGA